MEKLIPNAGVTRVLEAMRNVCLDDVVMAIDATPADIQTGAGCDYTIMGRLYNKSAAIAAIDLSASAIGGQTIPDGYKAAMFLLFDTSGDPVMKKSANVDRTSGKIVVPDFDITAYCCVGAVVVDNNSGATFTIGTTSLAATGVTDTYINVYNVVPGEVPAWG